MSGVELTDRQRELLAYLRAQRRPEGAASIGGTLKHPVDDLWALEELDLVEQRGRSRKKVWVARSSDVVGPEFTVSDRGFRHWEPVEVDRGAVVRVYESSASRDTPCLWLSVDAEAHLDEPPRPCAGVPAGVAKGSISAHMTLDQARLVHASLGVAILAREHVDDDA